MNIQFLLQQFPVTELHTLRRAERHLSRMICQGACKLKQIAHHQAEYEGCDVVQQRQPKKGRGPRYSNRRNGLIKEEDAGGDTDSYPSQAEGSDQVASLMCKVASVRSGP